MTGNLRVLRRLVLMYAMVTAEYRGGFFVYMLERVLVPVISLLVWLTVGEQGVGLPYSRSQFVTYFLLVSVVSMLTSTWLGEFVARNIRQGELSPWLLRPVPFSAQYVGNNVGEKLVKVPLLLPLVALAALAFRAEFEMPADLGAWLLFLLSLPMAAAVSFLLEFLVGSLAFWIQDVDGLVRAKAVIGSFLAGQFIPLALFPDWLSGFLVVQPFRYTLSFPLEILTGALSRSELVWGFTLQTAYCFGLWACYRLVWRYGLPAYSAAGA